MTELDEQALKAAHDALDALIGKHPTPSILVRRSRYEIAIAAITAYQNALKEKQVQHVQKDGTIYNLEPVQIATEDKSST